MSRVRHLLAVTGLIVAPLGIVPSVGVAQTGFVHLATHLVAHPLTLPSTASGQGFTAIFLKNPNGSSTQIYSLEFAPGSYTMARVEGTYQNCSTKATDVAFTITAGQWTFVDVPMSFVSCQIELRSGGHRGGTGTTAIAVQTFAGKLIVASCSLNRNSVTGEVTYTDHSKCHYTLPYLQPAFKLEIPDGGSVESHGSDTTTITPFDSDTGYAAYINGSFSAKVPLFQPATPDQFPDLQLVRTGGTYGGGLLTASYTLTNISSALARQISFHKAIPDSLFGGYPATMMTSTRGSCTPAGGDCFLRDLLPGESVDYTITMANTQGNGIRTPFCTSVVAIQPTLTGPPAYLESDTTNNRQPCKPANVQVTVSTGGSTPGNRTVAKGTSAVPMLQFSLNPATTQTLNNITIQAQGSGNDQVDVTAITLYLDANGNGLVDTGDRAIASSAFGANNGTAVLAVSPGLVVTGPTAFLVTYDFSVNIAQRLGGGLALALLPLCFVPVIRRRKRAVRMMLMIAIMGLGVTNCGGSSPTGSPSNAATYQVRMTGVNLSGVDVPNVSLSGAIVSIDR